MRFKIFTQKRSHGDFIRLGKNHLYFSIGAKKKITFSHIHIFYDTTKKAIKFTKASESNGKSFKMRAQLHIKLYKLMPTGRYYFKNGVYILRRK